MTEISLTGREENNCQEKIESQGGLAELSNDQEGSNIDSEEEILDDQTDATEAISAEVIESTSPLPVSYDFNSSSYYYNLNTGETYRKSDRSIYAY
ncbi:6958_t:CDS:2 [Racocetra fulgida]|uniref:6958_t:CDS:1 n=1 Tax=Racocetra fulgida TaxID=60492 RepID=A0A9N9DXQ4_9GLOM|nr:6958_t:CDS:2 [Racocetra fulgida]